MAEEREIMTFELKPVLAEFEAGIARSTQLVAQLKATLAAGGDTSEIEAQLRKQVEGFNVLVPAEQRASGATDQLVHSKRNLANVVRLVGGEFGGTIGQLGSLIAVFENAGKVVGVTAAALAGLAVLTQVFRSIQEEARKATEEQNKFNAALREARDIKAAVADTTKTDLEKYGARTPTNIQAAMETRDRLISDYRMDPARATAAAALGAALPGSVEDAAVLDVLHGAGASFATTDEARAKIAELKASGAYDRLLAKAKSYARDTEAVVGLTPEETLFKEIANKDTGGFAGRALPEMTFDEFKAKLPEQSERLAKAAKLRREIAAMPETWAGYGPTPAMLNMGRCCCPGMWPKSCADTVCPAKPTRRRPACPQRCFRSWAALPAVTALRGSPGALLR